MAALRTAITLWLAQQGKPHLPTLAAEAFDLMDGGLQQVRECRPATRRRKK
jgi:hypothetical protein